MPSIYLPGDQVLVYREKKLWDGPFKLCRYDGYKTAYVEIHGLIYPFSITAVKNYLTEDPKAPNQESGPSTDHESPQTTDSNGSPISIEELLTISIGKLVVRTDLADPAPTPIFVFIVANPDDPRFKEATKAEIEGLLKPLSFKKLIFLQALLFCAPVSPAP